MLLAVVIMTGIIALCHLVYKMEAGEATGSTYVMAAMVIAILIVSFITANNWVTQHADEVANATPTTEPRYTAVVKNADGTKTSYDVKTYDTKDNTMVLTLKDGTKVFIPITNITISEQTTGAN